MIGRLISAAIALLLIVGIIGWYQGWFGVQRTTTPEGKQGLTFTFNKEKYLKDREALKGKISETAKKFEAKFPGMSEKAKNLTGAAKEKWDGLMKKKDDLMGRFKKIESTEDEAAEKARKEIEAELQQFEDEFHKTELVPPPASK